MHPSIHYSITPLLQFILSCSEAIDDSTGSPCAEWQTSNYSLTVRAELSRNMNRLKLSSLLARIVHGQRQNYDIVSIEG